MNGDNVSSTRVRHSGASTPPSAGQLTQRMCSEARSLLLAHNVLIGTSLPVVQLLTHFTSIYSHNCCAFRSDVTRAPRCVRCSKTVERRRIGGYYVSANYKTISGSDPTRNWSVSCFKFKQSVRNPQLASKDECCLVQTKPGSISALSRQVGVV